MNLWVIGCMLVIVIDPINECGSDYSWSFKYPVMDRICVQIWRCGS